MSRSIASVSDASTPDCGLHVGEFSGRRLHVQSVFALRQTVLRVIWGRVKDRLQPFFAVLRIVFQKLVRVFRIRDPGDP